MDKWAKRILPLLVFPYVVAYQYGQIRGFQRYAELVEKADKRARRYERKAM